MLVISDIERGKLHQYPVSLMGRFLPSVAKSRVPGVCRSLPPTIWFSVSLWRKQALRIDFPESEKCPEWKLEINLTKYCVPGK
jgi:hypothetical protein